LITQPELHDPVRYSRLKELPTDDARAAVIEDCLTRAKVRFAVQKTARLVQNFSRIEQEGGPVEVKRKLNSLPGSAAKIKYLCSFQGIGPKYSRNLMMDVYHEDFRDSIAVDSRLKKVLEALGLPFDDRDYNRSEEFFLLAAREAGLNGWEMDRLLFSYLDQVLEALKAAALPI
jgi:hypothetical protein